MFVDAPNEIKINVPDHLKIIKPSACEHVILSPFANNTSPFLLLYNDPFPDHFGICQAFS